MHIFLLWAHGLVYFVRANGHFAMYLLLSIEEGGVPLPLPGDTVVAYAGYLSSRGEMAWWLALVAAVGASATGSVPLYLVARAKGHPWVVRYGRYLHLTPQREARIERWVQRRRGVAVFIGRLVPGMRVGTTALAGVFEIPFRSFIFYQTLSAIVWWSFWLWLGSTIGRRVVRMIRMSPTSFGLAMIFPVIVIVVILYVRHRAASERPPLPASVESTNPDPQMLET